MATNNTISRPGALLVLMVVSLFPALPAVAADTASPYDVTVPFTTGDESAAFRTGMEDVLVRLTGRRDAGQLPALSPLLEDAARYVKSYQRAPGGRLLVSYDAEAIEDAVAAAGLPFWGDARPSTMVWLAVDRGGGQRGLVTAEGAGIEKSAVEEVAAQRGMPLLWPSGSGSEDARQRFEQVWAGDAATLAAAAERYGADGVLVGKAVAGTGGNYSVDWTFIDGNSRSQGRGDLGAGVHLAADRYASQYASATAAQRTEIEVTITGVTNLGAYAEAGRELESLSAVREVALRRVLPDAVVFRVSARGGLDALRREAATSGRLRPASGEQGSAVFMYQP